MIRMEEIRDEICPPCILGRRGLRRARPSAAVLPGRISADNPPAITHPEYFYGFIGVALAWQILFLLIARDPSATASPMLPATLEKLAFGGAALILYLQRCLALQVLAFGLLDLLFAALFVASFLLARKPAA